MKQTLQLRIGQSLTMTPQLRQAIRLLQLSTLDLQAEVQEQLDSNMMLETAEDGEQRAVSDSAAAFEPQADAAESVGAEATLDRVAREDAAIPDDLPVDVVWDDIYEPPMHSAIKSSETPTDYYDIAASKTGQSLLSHLQWQLDLSPFSDNDRLIAEAILDALSEDGYLHTPPEDILAALPGDRNLDRADIETVLKRIQRFDPPGVAARSVAECLRIQLDQLDHHDHVDLNLARRTVDRHLELLAGGDLKTLAKRLKTTETQAQAIAHLVRSLQPHPGDAFTDNTAGYIIPDVFVKRRQGAWQVELNPEAAPRLRINTRYSGMVRRGDVGADNAVMKNHLQEARWFLRSLQSRNETLLRVATAIVERQLGYFERGDEAMRPLVLRDIAEAVDMHESTISRVTTQKYMHTPRGVLEFKFFFSSHVNTLNGGACSATAIRAMIRKLITDEAPNKPLSDNKIALTLSERGIDVARRTVAKYREAMHIPPSNERKRLA